MIKKISAAIVTIALIGCNLVTALSGTDESSGEMFSADEDAWVTLDGMYDYPISALDAEWDMLSDVEDMRKVTQIPDDILADISTENLIELVLQYPLLCDINAFDSIEDGYEHIKNQFNGITELLNREDCVNTLFNAYISCKIPEQKIIDYGALLSGNDYVEKYNNFIHDENNHEIIYEDAAIYETINILEMLLKDALENGGSLEEINEFANIYSNKLEQKSKSAYYRAENPIEVLQLIQGEESELHDVFFSSDIFELQKINNNYVIKTPGGTTLTCIYNDNIEYADPSSYTSYITKYHASLVSVASKTFNCHSFAWLKDLYPNTYQYLTLTSLTEFTGDSSYQKSTTASVGWIALFTAHSAIVTLTGKDFPYDSQNYPEAYMISKWGSGPIVAHYERHNPYYSSGETIKYYHLK